MNNLLKSSALTLSLSLFALSGLTAVVLAQGTGDKMPMGGMNMGEMKSMQALAKVSGKTFDIYWMSQMIAHHQAAVIMAKIVIGAGKDTKIKAAAQAVVTAQSAEVKQLTAWLKSWYNSPPNANQMQLMMTDMQPMMLAAKGGMDGMVMGDADRNFLENMIPHHQSAVEMAKLALTKALRPQLKTFAQQVIDDQSKEINQYQVWLKTMK
jgi:uncharacterized protein (DUF305 family)